MTKRRAEIDVEETEDWRRIYPGEQTNDDQEQRGSFERFVLVSDRFMYCR